MKNNPIITTLNEPRSFIKSFLILLLHMFFTLLGFATSMGLCVLGQMLQ